MSVLVAARRTWLGVAGRGHRDVDETVLAAAVLTAARGDAVRAGLDARVDDVVLGNAAGHGGNVARRAALAAGLGGPGMTLDRQCASGLAAVVTGAALVDSGQARTVVAGGVESCSRAPARSHGGLGYDRASFAPVPWADDAPGRAADGLARVRGIDRERQHAHAALAHARVLAAHERGELDAETVPVGTLRRDDHARVLAPAVLDRLPAAFGGGGTVTAASTAPGADGAAAVVLVADGARPAGVPGLRVRACASVPTEPGMPMLAPVAAVQQVCGRVGRTPGELAAVELVEAFAVQGIAVAADLGIDPGSPVWNAGGGTLGIGHPFGASGAVAVTRLFSRLVRQGAPAGTLGVAAAAAVGGLGVALLVEVVR